MAVLAGAGWLLAGAGEADAHPFGPPSRASLVAAGDVVELRWRSAPDDAEVLLALAGAGSSGASFELAGAGAGARGRGDIADHLLERVAVDQTGVACAGEVDGIDQLDGDGARFTFRCPSPVGEVDVRIGLLVDVHAAYRTIASGPNGQQQLYTAEALTHRWSLSGGSPQGGTAAGRAAWLLVGAGAVVAAAVPYALARHRRRVT